MALAQGRGSIALSFVGPGLEFDNDVKAKVAAPKYLAVKELTSNYHIMMGMYRAEGLGPRV